MGRFLQRLKWYEIDGCTSSFSRGFCSFDCMDKMAISSYAPEDYRFRNANTLLFKMICS